jgi:hypothetical protein
MLMLFTYISVANLSFEMQHKQKYSSLRRLHCLWPCKQLWLHPIPYKTPRNTVLPQKLTVTYLIMNSVKFKRNEGPLTCSQQFLSWTIHIVLKSDFKISSHLHLGLENGLIPWGSTIKLCTLLSHASLINITTVGTSHESPHCAISPVSN